MPSCSAGASPAPTDSFLGVVAGSIRFSYFHDLFGRLHLGPDDIITVLRRDGTVIMRTPFDLDVIGKNLGIVPGVMRALSEPSGSYSGLGALDGVPRLFVWRDGTRPLVVLVGKPWSSIFSLWRTEATRIGAMVMALISFVLGVTLFLAREIGRRAQAEDKLEELATTDALTGLKNRRKFDAAIEAEWRRAARHKTPLALLMIDADHFKSYNDTFGHQAGDQVLVGIAICISDSVRRAGDCAARYGGEEFAVLLPGLSSEDALRVAETIRLKVQQWSDDPTVTTVSIGVASLTPVDIDGMVGTREGRRQGALRGQGRRPQPVRAGQHSRSFRWWRSAKRRPSSLPAKAGIHHATKGRFGQSMRLRTGLRAFAAMTTNRLNARFILTSPDTSSSPRAGRRADRRAPCRRRCWRAGSRPWSRNRAARPRTRRRRSFAFWQARSWRR